MSDVTLILQKIESGDRLASKELLPLVYDELRKLAGSRMASERADHTLQPTALVHEAYMRLVKDDSPQWDSRGHFFGAAAEAMRRILIESARAKKKHKQEDASFSSLGENVKELSFLDSPKNMLEFDDALTKLEKEDAAIAQLVRLRLFAGLSMSDVARTLGISAPAAYKWWNYAVSWFQLELGDAG